MHRTAPEVAADTQGEQPADLALSAEEYYPVTASASPENLPLATTVKLVFSLPIRAVPKAEKQKEAIAGKQIEAAPTRFLNNSIESTFAPVLKPSEPRIVNRLAIAGLTLALLSFLPFVSGLSLLISIPFALAGAYCSWRAMLQIRDRWQVSRGLALAKAGLAISLVVLGVLALMGAAVLIAL